jgi:beta-galactosidase
LGDTIYLGVFGDDAFYEVFLSWLLKEKGLACKLETPPGVEVCERWKGERVFRFILNFTDAPQLIQLPVGYRNLLDDTPVSGTIQLAAKDVLILESQS